MMAFRKQSCEEVELNSLCEALERKIAVSSSHKPREINCIYQQSAFSFKFVRLFFSRHRVFRCSMFNTPEKCYPELWKWERVKYLDKQTKSFRKGQKANIAFTIWPGHTLAFIN